MIKYIETNGDGDIFLLDANGLIKWKKSYLVHHTMKISHDGKRLFFFSMEKRDYRGVEAKFDKIIALDIATGKEAGSWNVFDIKDQLEAEYGQALPLKKSSPSYNKENKKIGEIINEYTHFNSINLIPTNIDGFLNEEIIVNSGRGFVLFFNRDLKLSRKFWVDRIWNVNTHDAQITKDGNLLIYKNWDLNTRNSSLEVISINTHELLWKYELDPDGQSFKSSKFGSVQLFDDSSFLYSDMDKGGHFTVVDSDGKKLSSFYFPQLDPRDNLAQTFHTIRRVKFEDLSSEVQGVLDKNLDRFLLKDFYKIFVTGGLITTIF
ncbi:MAG: hypothetical protein H7281_15535 [Bacteriovorax sp.]|nr:hypothetical protein [Bacteriovorax sp.]